jgi:hypothetical protein
LLDLLSVEVDHTSESEIDWGLERVGQAFGSNWEGNSVVESNVLVHTLAESLVADLSHRVDKFLAESVLSTLSLDLLEEEVEFFHWVLGKFEGLDHDLGLVVHGHHWFSVVVKVLGSDIHPFAKNPMEKFNLFL